LFPHMTVLQNVMFGLRMRKVPAREARAQAIEALELVRLPHVAERKPHALSGGQRQRVAVARALVNRPAVLLLDEPLGALDLKLRKAMQFELKTLQQQVGITFVYVTHDQEEALTMADRIAVMNEGKVLQVGPPDDIYERPTSRFVADFIGETNFLGGRLAEVDGRFAAVATDGGAVLWGELRDDDLAPGSPAALALRPEKLSVEPDPGLEAADPPAAGLDPHETRLRGVIRAAHYLGTDSRYEVEAEGGLALVARVQNQHHGYGGMLKVGTPATLTWRTEHASVLRQARRSPAWAPLACGRTRARHARVRRPRTRRPHASRQSPLAPAADAPRARVRRLPASYDRRDVRDAVLRVAGDPYALGLAHGRALAAWVRDYAEERVRLACSPVWSGRESTRAEVMALARACLSVHEETYPDLAEELRGIADGAGLSPAELVVSGGFTDFVDAVAAGALGEGPHGAGAASGGAAAAGAPGGGEARPAGGDEDDCTAFLVPAARMADGAPAFAQTWDMHEGSADHLVLLEGRPRGAPAFVVMTTAGCVGMIGMNEAGLTVGINNLTAADGRVGVTWPFVVRAMLREETLEAALEVLARAPLCGGHNYLVMDAAGRGANVEAMPTARAVTALAEAV